MPLSRLSNSKVGVIIPSFFEAQFVDRKIKNTLFVVPGMGKVRAAIAVAQLRKSGVKSILLAGFAGGLRGLRVGEAVSAGLVIEGDYDAGDLQEYPNVKSCRKIVDSSMKCIFISQDRFLKTDVYSAPGRKNRGGYDKINIHLNIASPVAVDMEAYAAVAAGHLLGASVYVAKIISDVVGRNSEGDFLSACSKQSVRMNNLIKEAVKEIRRIKR